MQKPILLKDLLRLSKNDLERAKVRFCQHDGQGTTSLEYYIRNPDIINIEGLFNRTKTRFFKVGQIAICLFQLSKDTWLLSTMKEVTKELGIIGGSNYDGEELQDYSAYFGRVVIKHKKGQAQHVWLKTIIDDLEVIQIYPNVFDGIDFPGYDKVRISYNQLFTIINRRTKDWISALENQKAVYLITDKENGKQYVGSAYGENGMLLQRWSNYVANGHGGNKLLKKIVDESGIEYIEQNFQYSILENYNSRVDKEIILNRESWWKETLGSRAFGLNAN